MVDGLAATVLAAEMAATINSTCPATRLACAGRWGLTRGPHATLSGAGISKGGNRCPAE